MLHFRSKPLPEIAENYLKEIAASRRKNTIAMYRAALHHFYRFLAQSKLTVTDLTLRRIEEFDEDLERHCLKLVTRQATLGDLHRYLRWLELHGHVPNGFCIPLFPNYRADLVVPLQSVLPPLAERFLEVLAASSKKNTVGGYRSSLRAFYFIHQK